MRIKTKETLLDVLVAAIVSAVVVTLFNVHKDKLPNAIKKHFKE
jgi:hypothetical protein